jgi:hypothetical protein
MKIANIIYEKELVNHTKSEYVNYFNEPKVYEELNKSLPTLYVGWSFMKASNPDNPIIQNADILKKKIITNELYWEFSFHESKPSHIKGVDTFVGLAPQFYFTPKYTYTNLDPMFFQITVIEDLMAVLPKDITKAYNLKNEMLYVLNDNKIWGIDLRMYDFFKFDIQEINNMIKSRSFFYNEDLDAEIYQSYYKIFPNFQYLKRYVVTLVSK